MVSFEYFDHTGFSKSFNHAQRPILASFGFGDLLAPHFVGCGVPRLPVSLRLSVFEPVLSSVLLPPEMPCSLIGFRDSQGFSPFGNSLACDSPPVTHSQVGLSGHGTSEVIKEHQACMSTLLIEPTPLWPLNVAVADSRNPHVTPKLVGYDIAKVEQRCLVRDSDELETVNVRVADAPLHQRLL